MNKKEKLECITFILLLLVLIITIIYSCYNDYKERNAYALVQVYEYDLYKHGDKVSNYDAWWITFDEFQRYDVTVDRESKVVYID